MSQYVRPNTTASQLRGVIGAGSDRERIRSSMSRRRWLERLACIHAGEPIYIELGGEHAYCDIAPASSKFGTTDRVIIHIPTKVPDQVGTNLTPKVWDALFQKAELYHEFGHYLYTDWPSFEEELLDVEMSQRPIFKDWWNIIEDAAIERLLAGRFNIENDLKVKNENLLKSNLPRVERDVKFEHAVGIALMEYKHPLGRLEKLLDDDDDDMTFWSPEVENVFCQGALPIIRDMVPDIVSNGDPVERNRSIRDLFDALQAEADELESQGEMDEFKIDILLGGSDDGEERGDGSEGESVNGEPMSEGEKMQVEIQIDPDQEFDESDEDGVEVEVEIQQQYGDQVQQDEEVEEDEAGEDIEAWLQVVHSNWENDYDHLSLEVAEDEDYVFQPETYQNAKRLATPLQREFEQRLKQERKTKQKRGQRWGKLDGKSLYKSERGETRLFKRKVHPDEKDYSAVILIDKSGSMTDGQKDPSHVEEAGGALAIALENVGVGVAMMEYNSGSATLTKPFGQGVEATKRKIFNGRNGGGTPTSNALKLARERLEGRDGHPFIIILTDGQPDNTNDMRDVLHSTNIPVVGIYVDSTGNFSNVRKDDSQYYHQLVFCKSDEAMDAARDLTRRIMF